MAKNDIHNNKNKYEVFKESITEDMNQEITIEINEYIKHLSTNPGKGQKKIESYATKLKHVQTLKRFYNKINKAYYQISDDDIFSYITHLEEEGIKQSSIDRIVAVLKVHRKWYMKKHTYKQVNNALEELSTRRARTELGEIPKYKEVLKCREHTTSTRDRALFSFALEAGSEIGAVMEMKIKDINLNNKIATYSLPRYKRGRQDRNNLPLILSKIDIVNWINVHPDKNNKDAYLWTHINNPKRLTYRYILIMIKETAKKGGFDFRGTHTMRKVSMNYFIHLMDHKDFCMKFGLSFNSQVLHHYLTRKDKDGLKKRLAKKFGVLSEDYQDKREEIRLKECLFCGESSNSEEQLRCGRCGMNLDPSEALKKQKNLEKQLSDLQDAIKLLQNKN